MKTLHMQCPLLRPKTRDYCHDKQTLAWTKFEILALHLGASVTRRRRQKPSPKVTTYSFEQAVTYF